MILLLIRICLTVLVLALIGLDYDQTVCARARERWFASVSPLTLAQCQCAYFRARLLAARLELAEVFNRAPFHRFRQKT